MASSVFPAPGQLGRSRGVGHRTPLELGDGSHQRVAGGSARLLVALVEAEVPARLLLLSEIAGGQRQRIVRRPEPRRQRQRLAVLFRGDPGLAPRLDRLAQSIVADRRLGIVLESGAVVENRLRRVALCQQQIPQFDPQRSVLRAEGRRLLQHLEAFFGSAAAHQHPAVVVDPAEACGLEGAGARVGGRGRAELLVRVEHHPQLAHRPRIFRLGSDSGESFLDLLPHARCERARVNLRRPRQPRNGRRPPQGMGPGERQRRHYDGRSQQKTSHPHRFAVKTLTS